MSVFAADMFASISAAPSDRTLRPSHTTDPLRSSDGQKGFSAVLHKARHTDVREGLHKADDRPSFKRVDDKSHVREPKNRDNSRTRTEHSDTTSKEPNERVQAQETTGTDHSRIRAAQSDTSSPQTSKGVDSDSTPNSSADITQTDSDSVSKEGADTVDSDDQGEPSWTLAASGALPTTTQPIHPTQVSDDANQSLSGDDPKSDSTFTSSQSMPAVLGESRSTVMVSRTTDSSSPQTGTADVAAHQQPSFSNVSMSHAGGSAHGSVPVEPHEGTSPNNTDTTEGKGRQEVGSVLPTQDSDSPPSESHTLSQKEFHAAVNSVIENRVGNRFMDSSDRKPSKPTLDGPLPSPGQDHPLALQDDGNDDESLTPRVPQGPQPAFRLAEDFSKAWSGHHEGQHDQVDVKLLQGDASEQHIPNGQRGELLALGTSGVLQPSSPTAPSPTQTVSAMQSAQPSQVAAQSPLPVTMKAVVFDVTQPDLGHVNVRVAMTNDVVHAYLSADRQDVGQSLLSGQDRLQSSLQASGLDMGQFRVQVDREWTSQGGHEWHSRGDESPAHQQREQSGQQDQFVNSSPFDQESDRVLSVFA